jgi:hypothetical protein
MTLIDYAELCDYWADHPPVHLLAAAYLGVRGSSSRASAGASRGSGAARERVPSTNSGLRELLGAPGFAKGDLHMGCAEAVVLDFDAMLARAKQTRKAASG